MPAGREAHPHAVFSGQREPKREYYLNEQMKAIQKGDRRRGCGRRDIGARPLHQADQADEGSARQGAPRFADGLCGRVVGADPSPGPAPSGWRRRCRSWSASGAAHSRATPRNRDDSSNCAMKWGDLPLQVVFHARMAEERGPFDFGGVVEAVTTKMIRRHPHVSARRKRARLKRSKASGRRSRRR